MAQPRVIGDPGLAAAAESAIRKLMAAFPGAMRARAAAIRQRLFVDTTGWRPPAESLAMLPVVQDAVWTDRRLEFEYSDSRQSVSTRVVDPLGLVSKGGAWYLFANSAKGFRTYRVSRIQSARVLDEPCLRPPDFDLEAQWKLAMDRFSRERTKFPVILWLDSTGVNWAQQWLDLSPGPDPDTYGIAFDAEEQAAFVVLGLASHARVVSPPALADRVRREFSAALSIASASLRD
jgi:predicted DNA-binding transcriptional regulator YafY